MASVSSLDQDMRKLRLDRYTPAAASEVRTWIESTLGEQLQAGDLLEALKDGVALCKYEVLVVANKPCSLSSSIQTRQSRPPTSWYTLQSVHNALHTARKHIPIPHSMRAPAADATSTRSLPYGRLI